MVRERWMAAIGKGVLGVLLGTVLSMHVQAAPHVVILVVDRLPADLQRLEKESAVLEDFFLRPTGIATRAALWTGREEFRCGVVARSGGRNWLRGDVKGVGDTFAAAGYSTGLFGTWGLGDAAPSRPQDHGFQKVEVHGGEAVGALADSWNTKPVDPVAAAFSWMSDEAKTGKKVLLGIVPPPGANAVDSALKELDRAGLSRDTMLIVLEDRRSSTEALSVQSARSRCFVQWPEGIPVGKKINGITVPMDLVPTICSLANVPKPETADDGLDVSAALLGKGEIPSSRTLCMHEGNWRGDENPESQRSHGFAAWDARWWLQGTNMFDWKASPALDQFETKQEEGVRLLSSYGRWWQRSQPFLREPVTALVGSEKQPIVRLMADSWWPSLEEPDALSAEGAQTQAQARERLEQMRIIGTRQALTSMSGRWRLQISRPGNYLVRAWLVPREAPEEEKQRWSLRAGEAHMRAGKHEAVGKIKEGATEVLLASDFNEGPVEMEVWFTNQLTGKKIQGALGIEIQRLGERRTPDLRMDLTPKEAPKN